jgi:hypothetical protein
LYVGQVSKPAAHCGGYGKPPYSVPLTYQLDSQGVRPDGRRISGVTAQDRVTRPYRTREWVELTEVG